MRRILKTQEVTELFDLSASIDQATAALQTRTCQKVIEMLQKVPGIILGDDVGMGKTYIAICVVMWFLANYPERKVLIITPGWQLNKKWHNDLRNFIEKNLQAGRVSLRESDIVEIQQGWGSYVSKIASAAKKAKIILVPVNIFRSLGKEEKGFLLACWFKYRRLWEKTRIQILRALGWNSERTAPEDYRQMGISYSDIPESWYKELDRIYEEEGISPDGIWQLKSSVNNLRYKVINQVLPGCSLLILDEAHKMKNDCSVTRRALEIAVRNKYSKGLFLTATPFQLGESELRSILEMFKAAYDTEEEEQFFVDTVEKLFGEMKKYQLMMRTFEDYLHGMSPDEGIQLEEAIKTGKIADLGYDVRETYELYQKLIEQKNALQAVMRMLIVRNVKSKDEYRNEVIGSLDNEDRKGIPLPKEAFIPFALSEKAIYQLLTQGSSTFISNEKQSFTSSYEAFEVASIYQRDLSAIMMLRNLDLKKLPHPKLNAVVEDVVQALLNGEKTLLFCNRIETVRQLKRKIDKKLSISFTRDIKRLFTDQETEFFYYSKRFGDKYDKAWFLLQESYIQSVLVPVMEICRINPDALPQAADIVEEVNKAYRKYDVTTKTSLMYVKRIVERITFKRVLAGVEGWRKKLAAHPELLETVKAILNPDYIELGLNHEMDEEEKDMPEGEGTVKQGKKSNIISKARISKIINYKGIWHYYRELLNKLTPVERDSLVSSMNQFLRKDNRFLIKLKETKNRYADKDESIVVEKAFSRGSLLDWKNAFQRFLEKYYQETVANREQMLIGLKYTDIVATIDGSTSNEMRERIKAGFNTPFYPQILIATSTMQEGLDLQVECKRVFHYDLEWNPASLEQRVGRIDRIGSLVSKLRQQEKDVTLDVYYPYLKNTIDESIYKTVKEREKWFNLILGGTPQWDTYEIDPQGTNIKPWVFRNLQIDLSVND